MNEHLDLITSENSWKGFDQSLSSLGTTKKDRAFEELTRMYLLTEPTFSNKIKKNMASLRCTAETPILIPSTQTTNYLCSPATVIQHFYYWQVYGR